MKKNKLVAVLVVLLGMVVVASPAMAAGSALRETPLGQGTVRIYDFGSSRLHAFQTGDPLGDTCFLLEGPKQIVAIESPAFKQDIANWKGYVGSLGKPLTDILLAAHPAGGRWYGNATSHATAGAKQAITEGATKKLAESLGETFSPAFDTDIPGIDAVLTPGPNTVGSMEFVITEAGDGYEIAIPAINAIYTHMLGADSHSILAGQDHITAVLASLESIKAKGYQLILSGHHAPETQTDVAAKIAYVKAVRTMAAQSADRADFIARVKRAFPDYVGLNYLEMTAGFLFTE
ncbi:hypothetical protein SAMN05421830_11838 [Desulfomicrobium norvegicum]|uniref:Glyoxylase, beta-lactamase superfamily II n=1 Tax=Desulfomicrobium norvegicum (strain DSM 1741 / NCIMB 8310) TaxID=52561 RepID=A0A8G2F8Y6_DESNO|nr:hypothetical protein [Desulfomicrobium norvegicum]SFM17700.1 hypothetical protein SAMN05421830_11838 [Desulfomicrobium norvegicum]